MTREELAQSQCVPLSGADHCLGAARLDALLTRLASQGLRPISKGG